MKKLFVTFLVIASISATGFSQQASPGGIDDSRTGSAVLASVLFDSQAGIDPPAFSVISCAFSDVILGGAHAAGADDFTVPSDGWEISTIRVYGVYSDPVISGNTGPAASVAVYILPKTGSVPTSTDLSTLAIWFDTNLAYTELDVVFGGDFEITLPDVQLAQGDYWLVVLANIELFVAGQWNWTETSLTPNSGTTNGDESAWFQSTEMVASPITGSTTCVGAWNSRVTGCSMSRNPDTNPPYDRDLAFQLEGTVLPVELQSFKVE